MQKKKNLRIEKITNELSQALGTSSIAGKFVKILRSYPVKEVATVFSEELQNLPTAKILQLAKILASLDNNKKFCRFLSSLTLTKKHNQTVIFIVEVLANVDEEKCIECIRKKLLERFSEKKTQAIICVACEKRLPGASIIDWMVGPCAVPFLAMWQKVLRRGDVQMRKSTIALLGKFTCERQNVAALLVNYLNHKNSEICRTTATALANLGLEAVPILVSAMAKEDSRIRLLASWSIGKIGEKAEEAIPVLIDALGDEDKRVNRNTLWALNQMHSKIQAPVIAALPKKEPLVQVFLIELLVNHFAHCPKTVTALADLLPDVDHDLQEVIIRSLAKLGNISTPAIPKLLTILDTDNPELQIAVVCALIKLNARDERIESLVYQLYEMDIIKIREEAVKLIGKIGNQSIDALKLVVRSLYDADAKVQRAAIRSLRKFNEIDQTTVSRLMSYLDSTNRILKIAAIETMEYFLPVAHRAAPVLIELIDNEDLELREASLKTIAAMEEYCVEGLIDILQNERKTRKFAIAALAHIGSPAVHLLLQTLREQDSTRRRAAVETLIKIGAPAIPGLIEVLKEDNFWIKESAITALATIRQGVPPQLAELMRSGNPEWKNAAMGVLKKIHTMENASF